MLSPLYSNSTTLCTTFLQNMSFTEGVVSGIVPDSGLLSNEATSTALMEIYADAPRVTIEIDVVYEPPKSPVDFAKEYLLRPAYAAVSSLLSRTWTVCLAVDKQLTFPAASANPIWKTYKHYKKYKQYVDAVNNSAVLSNKLIAIADGEVEVSEGTPEEEGIFEKLKDLVKVLQNPASFYELFFSKRLEKIAMNKLERLIAKKVEFDKPFEIYQLRQKLNKGLAIIQRRDELELQPLIQQYEAQDAEVDRVCGGGAQEGGSQNLLRIAQRHALQKYTHKLKFLKMLEEIYQLHTIMKKVPIDSADRPALHAQFEACLAHNAALNFQSEADKGANTLYIEMANAMANSEQGPCTAEHLKLSALLEQRNALTIELNRIQTEELVPIAERLKALLQS